ncbi:hypothetical protein J1N35_003400 [Gossypium stocksii]|uniref:Uncharacterized protein n=1 Tax=Gossypium stocksii TaxID=47602 RepID=A0A9D3WN29_9ROSI|nr:hypothetical protein J1N35_003400 [Gossypium stocksii]
MKRASSSSQLDPCLILVFFRHLFFHLPGVFCVNIYFCLLGLAVGLLPLVVAANAIAVGILPRYGIDESNNLISLFSFFTALAYYKDMALLRVITYLFSFFTANSWQMQTTVSGCGKRRSSLDSQPQDWNLLGIAIQEIAPLFEI